MESIWEALKHVLGITVLAGVILLAAVLFHWLSASLATHGMPQYFINGSEFVALMLFIFDCILVVALAGILLVKFLKKTWEES